MAAKKSKSDPQQLPPHIIIVPEQVEEGDLEISVQAQGFSLLEVPSLLALAKKKVEEKLGI